MTTIQQRHKQFLKEVASIAGPGNTLLEDNGNVYRLLVNEADELAQQLMNLNTYKLSEVEKQEITDPTVVGDDPWKWLRDHIEVRDIDVQQMVAWVRNEYTLEALPHDDLRPDLARKPSEELNDRARDSQKQEPLYKLKLNAEFRLDELAKQLARNKNVNYFDAYEKVCKEHPSLAADAVDPTLLRGRCTDSAEADQVTKASRVDYINRRLDKYVATQKLDRESSMDTHVRLAAEKDSGYLALYDELARVQR